MLSYLYVLDYDCDTKQVDLNQAGRPSDVGLEELEKLESGGFRLSDVGVSDNLVVLRLMTHASVHVIAEKYGIAPLKCLAESKFGAMVAEDFRPLPCGFKAVADVVYSSTPDTDSGLRDIVIAVCDINLDKIVENNAEMNSVDHSIFEEHPELAIAVLPDHLERHETFKNHAFRRLRSCEAILEKAPADISTLQSRL